jgi:transcription elongation GreA/GreB family factor
MKRRAILGIPSGLGEAAAPPRRCRAWSAVQPRIDKANLLAAVRAELGAELERATRRATDAAEAATHEENRAEGDKDMRSTESSYVARGQVERVRAIEEALARLQSVRLREFAPEQAIEATALVELENAGRRVTYFLLPAAGGIRVDTGGASIQTLATTSPLGAALLGLSEGDDAEVVTGQGSRSYAIVSVR